MDLLETRVLKGHKVSRVTQDPPAPQELLVPRDQRVIQELLAPKVPKVTWGIKGLLARKVRKESKVPPDPQEATPR